MEGVRSARRHTIRLLQDDAAARALAADAAAEHERLDAIALDLVRTGVQPTAAAVRAETGARRSDASRIASLMRDISTEGFVAQPGGWDNEESK